MEIVNMNKDGYLEIYVDDDRRITGYVTSGGRGKQGILIHNSILPYNFFDEFILGKFKYYRETGEVIEDYNFNPPENDITEIEETETETETVSKEEFDNLKSQFDEMKKLLESLLGGKK